ncbi:hypothetical protein [Alteromonas sp. M12]|uniref:hypothetical protein n=1 Tax=Alteromonas sp. M12 TaxID=3135644 RepID=UPI00319DB566
MTDKIILNELMHLTRKAKLYQPRGLTEQLSIQSTLNKKNRPLRPVKHLLLMNA